MTKQITVRLPDEDVAFLDRMVAEGRGSRASVVTTALERERRRERARVDARILAAESCDSDMESLAEFTARSFPELD